jgi:hypothetical protein
MTPGARMGGLVTSSIPQDAMIERSKYPRVAHANQPAEIARQFGLQQRAPDMWIELIAGAFGMLAVVGLMYLVLSYA